MAYLFMGTWVNHEQHIISRLQLKVGGAQRCTGDHRLGFVVVGIERVIGAPIVRVSTIMAMLLDCGLHLGGLVADGGHLERLHLGVGDRPGPRVGRDRELLRTSLLFNLRVRPDGGLAWKWDPRPMAGATPRTVK